jgi:hypothetical protein
MRALVRRTTATQFIARVKSLKNIPETSTIRVAERA